MGVRNNIIYFVFKRGCHNLKLDDLSRCIMMTVLATPIEMGVRNNKIHLEVGYVVPAFFYIEIKNCPCNNSRNTESSRISFYHDIYIYRN